MRRLIVGLAVLTCCTGRADADTVWLGPSQYASSLSSGAIRGFGTWYLNGQVLRTDEQMPSIVNLTDGYTAVPGSVFEYVAAPEDVDKTVWANWTITRPFTSTGGVTTNYARAAVFAELVEDMGGSMMFKFDSQTTHAELAYSRAVLTDPEGPVFLSPLQTMDNRTYEATTVFSRQPGTDSFMQGTVLYLGPTVAGQKIRISLNDGVVSRTYLGSGPPTTVVPAPSSLACLIGVGVLVGLNEWRKKRRNARR